MDPKYRNDDAPPDPAPSHGRGWIPVALGAGILLLLLSGTVMVLRAESKTNKVALAHSAKRVTVVEAKPTTYRASRRYVGTIEPWVEAKIGPQLVSAYVDTVLVRPGAVVKKGDVLATLDCRNANAISQGIAMQARALEAHQNAVANESSRIRALLDGGFVSPNEAEQKEAESASEQAKLLAQQAKLLGSSLEVNDCILRAPFSGEIATRGMDPGAFVRPGSAIVSLVDRTSVRISADAPEVDFDVVAPRRNALVHVLATNRELDVSIARRAPAADASTRTIHFEIDFPDPRRTMPVGTTAELHIEVGEPSPALVVPLSAVAIRGAKASVFLVEGSVAHVRVVPMMGETAGRIFLEPQIAPGSHVVTEGRALLSDGDTVDAILDNEPARTSPAPAEDSGALAQPSSHRSAGKP